MRAFQLLVIGGLLAASLVFQSQAAEVAPVNIERFAIAKSTSAVEKSAGIERTATLDGTQYAVIAPIFNELNTGNYSFIRFLNLISTASTFTVKVVGSPSGNVYGTTTISVPASASTHKDIGSILTAANASTLTGGDTAYALYISNPDLSGYQHVVYSYVSKFFENASLCQTSLSHATVRYLPNVHTKIIGDAGFPSKIYIHNYYNTAVTYNVSVYEASAGSLIGTVAVSTQPNSTYALDFSFFETQLNWTPTGNQGYANLIFTPQTAISGVTLPPATVGHFIFNNAFNAYVNMSEACAVNPGAASTGSSATTSKTVYAGTLAGSNSAAGTLSISIPTGTSSTSAQIASTSSVEKSQAILTATGSVTINGTTIALTGTYNNVTNAVSLTGGGYTFTGTLANGTFTGTYTGPSGAQGSFSASDTTSTVVTAYCGTFKDNPPDTNSGVFNIQVSLKGAVSGTYSGKNGNSGTLTGSVSGTSLTVSNGSPSAIKGTISGTKLSGTITFNDGTGGTGTFSGNKCDLPATK